MRSKKTKVNNSEKIYSSDELNLAMEIEFHGGHRLNSTFKTEKFYIWHYITPIHNNILQFTEIKSETELKLIELLVKVGSLASSMMFYKKIMF